MIPLALECHTPGYKSMGREQGSSNLLVKKGMMAQDVHKHKATAQALPDSTHTFNKGTWSHHQPQS